MKPQEIQELFVSCLHSCVVEHWDIPKKSRIHPFSCKPSPEYMRELSDSERLSVEKELLNDSENKDVLFFVNEHRACLVQKTCCEVGVRIRLRTTTIPKHLQANAIKAEPTSVPKVVPTSVPKVVPTSLPEPTNSARKSLLQRNRVPVTGGMLFGVVAALVIFGLLYWQCGAISAQVPGRGGELTRKDLENLRQEIQKDIQAKLNQTKNPDSKNAEPTRFQIMAIQNMLDDLPPKFGNLVTKTAMDEKMQAILDQSKKDKEEIKNTVTATVEKLNTRLVSLETDSKNQVTCLTNLNDYFSIPAEYQNWKTKNPRDAEFKSVLKTQLQPLKTWLTVPDNFVADPTGTYPQDRFALKLKDQTKDILKNIVLFRNPYFEQGNDGKYYYFYRVLDSSLK